MTGVDIRRLIAIAQYYKVITRLHEYPMYIFKKQVHSQHLQTQQDESDNSMDDAKHCKGFNSNFKPGGVTLLHASSSSIIQAHAGSSSITQGHTAVPTQTGNINFNPNQNNIKDSNGVPLINAMKIKKMNGRSTTNLSGHSDTINDVTVPRDFSAILCTLKGAVCLDSICCDYEMSPSEIFDSPNYYIVYK